MVHARCEVHDQGLPQGSAESQWTLSGEASLLWTHRRHRHRTSEVELGCWRGHTPLYVEMTARCSV